MAGPTGHKTFKYKLHPTPQQAAQLAGVLRVCRELYNAALQERKEAWQQCHISVTYYQQKAELPDIRQIRKDCAAIHSQVLNPFIRIIDICYHLWSDEAVFFRLTACYSSGTIVLAP